ncbi:DUF4879 domain-containing protein [Paenibacillus sp. 28ISP30-2]|uniref:DUF4879 domain-containing protein n=1 Tax=Paenibacillus sp. IHB B 3084 TaxID=867076 RepID=UPI0007221A97|nr:DUF4879 domain-containing protein [Paenibacillus sp. IHB B 3084]ALP36009.1 hypothetical protein ASL14_07335 [Paenibacillus sp. IHB B 3084]MBE0343063.1 DUF4879 domain-containing protein [Paenibacillus sp. 28ISP30-2]
MKKLYGLALVLVLALSFNVTAFAKGDVTQTQPLTKEEVVNSDEFLAAVEAAKASFESQKSKNADGPVLQAAVPPVSHFNVYAVASPYGGQEIYGFNSNPYGTKNDHHGDWIQCVTFEIGYSNYSTRSGKLNGISMKNDWTQNLDLDSDGMIDAFVRSWMFESPSEGGQFVGDVDSTSSPWNHMQTWINVH